MKMIDKKDDDNRTNEHFYSKYEHQINSANMHDDDVNLDAYC